MHSNNSIWISGQAISTQCKAFVHIYIIMIRWLLNFFNFNFWRISHFSVLPYLKRNTGQGCFFYHTKWEKRENNEIQRNIKLNNFVVPFLLETEIDPCFISLVEGGEKSCSFFPVKMLSVWTVWQLMLYLKNLLRRLLCQNEMPLPWNLFLHVPITGWFFSMKAFPPRLLLPLTQWKQK